MTDAQRPGPEPRTEVIPALSERVARTQELPVVTDETEVVPPAVPAPVPAVAAPAAPAPTPPASNETEVVPPAVPAPAPPVASPPVASPAPSGAAVPADRAVRGRGPGRRALLGVLALVVALAVVAAVLVVRDRGGATSAGSGTSRTAAKAVPVTVTSFDPSGGSGFRSEGASTWRTQTYASATFGNLKDGVGLLLDVGSPQAVRAVTFDVVGGAVAAEVRAADESGGTAAAFTKVGATGQASGATTVPVTGAAKHRYWLIWVTRLSAQDGGYRAVIKAPSVRV